MKINSYGWTYVGRREQNQDSILSLEIDANKNIYFYAVADGMGGMVGGEIASEIVTRTCKDYLTHAFHNKPNLHLKKILKRVFYEIDNQIKKRITSQKDLSGMGSTLTCLLIKGNKYVVGNIGDSRTYILDSNHIKQLTIDHSYIQDYKDQYDGQVDEGVMKKYGHLVTRSLSGAHDDPEIFPKGKNYLTLEKGTAFLLCSDGLLVNKKDEQTKKIIHKVCLGTKNPKEAVSYLVKLAYRSGSTDNISVIFVEAGNFKRKNRISLPKSFVQTTQPGKSETKTSKILKNVRYALVILIFLGLAWAVYLIIPKDDFQEEEKTKPTEINQKGTISKTETKQLTGQVNENIKPQQKLSIDDVSVGTGILRKNSTITWASSGGNNIEYTVKIKSTTSSENYEKTTTNYKINLQEFKKLKNDVWYTVQIIGKLEDSIEDQSEIKRFKFKN